MRISQKEKKNKKKKKEKETRSFLFDDGIYLVF